MTDKPTLTVKVEISVQGLPEEMAPVAAEAIGAILRRPRELRIAQCDAPAPNDASRTCGRWYVAGGLGKGMPPRHCSSTCRKRAERHRRQRERVEGIEG